MAAAHDDWKVLRHGPIEKLADNLWRVTGEIPRMSLERTMVVARLRSGELVFHSPIAMEEGAMREIEAWGTPAYIVVPNGGHRLDAPAYKKRYPQARVVAPAGSREKVAAVVPVDLSYADFPKDDDSVRLEHLHGVADSEGAMLVRSPDGVSVVLNDVMFNMDTKKDFLGWFFTTLMGSAPGPRVSRLAKMVFVKDKQALRADFERLAATPDLVRVIVAHEKVASGADAAASLRQAATYL